MSEGPLSGCRPLAADPCTESRDRKPPPHGETSRRVLGSVRLRCAGGQLSGPRHRRTKSPSSALRGAGHRAYTQKAAFARRSRDPQTALQNSVPFQLLPRIATTSHVPSKTAPELLGLVSSYKKTREVAREKKNENNTKTTYERTHRETTLRSASRGQLHLLKTTTCRLPPLRTKLRSSAGRK